MKPLYIFTLLTIIATSVVGYMNRSKLIDARNEKDKDTRIVIDTLDKVEARIEEINKQISQIDEQVKAHNAAEFAKTDQEKELAKANADEKQALADAEAVQMEIDKINAEIAKALEDIKSVADPDQLQPARDALKTEIAQQETTITNLDKEIAMVVDQIKENRGSIKRFAEAQSLRSQKIKLDTEKGRITAVNPDWAFCVVNMGKSKGVNMDSKLLVTRDNQLVGKLIITEIQSGQTLANIDPKSLKDPAGIRPGDVVIFDSK